MNHKHDFIYDLPKPILIFFIYRNFLYKKSLDNFIYPYNVVFKIYN